MTKANRERRDLIDAPEKSPSKLSRWYCLLRYHKPQQLLLRLRSVMRNRLLRRFGAGKYANVAADGLQPRQATTLSELLGWKLDERRSRNADERAERFVAGELTLLNQTVDFADGIDWRLNAHPNLDPLWRFQLHYHEILLDLIAADEPYTDLAWSVAIDWIDQNPASDGRVFADAWHPFCISRRLPVWLLLWAAAPPAEGDRNTVLASIVAQANFLADHLETDLGGNHLLENLRALAMAAGFFTGDAADRWLAVVDARMRGELERQILPHGEHFERSLMYHAFMLEAVLDVAAALRSLRPELASYCATVATKMAVFLRQVVHPDGDIAQFGDSALGEAPPPQALINRACGLDQPALPVGAHTSGEYWGFRDGTNWLIFDAAPAAPDHLPAHAHGDLLTLEASLGGQRVFVDSGVYEYAAGEMRSYCRSTAAHNVPTIDGADQFDMWSRFRVGYRGWPLGLATGNSGEFAWARASHNAYRRLGIPTVSRWLACRVGGPWFCVDWCGGSVVGRFVDHLHIHPAVDVEQVGRDRLSLAVAGEQFTLQILGGGDAELARAWYCPKFGQRIEAPVVRWSSTGDDANALGWALFFPGQEPAAQLQTQTSGQLELAWQDLRWNPAAEPDQ